MNYGRVGGPSSSRSRFPSTARYAATSAILTVISSKSDRAPTKSTVNARPWGDAGLRLRMRAETGGLHRTRRSNMKAIVVHQYGGPEVLKFEDYPDPVPGQGEVLVRVAASSVNPIDYKRRAGLTKDFYPMTFPGLIGVDLAGTVAKPGPGVEGFSVGDQVFAIADNTYAELCVVKAAILARVPKGLDLVQAAALPL